MVNDSKEKAPSTKKRKKNKRKKMSLLNKVLISLTFVCVFCISILGGVFVYSYGLLDKIEQVTLDKEDLSTNSYVSKDNIKNIALFGVDSTDNGEYGRSDSIMILTIDRVNDELKVSSIMRDSYVNIPNHNKDKINHAYAFGGPQLAIKTLNQNFNLDIQDFITVDFESFPKIIDALGGIDLNITQDEIDAYININSHINHLNALNDTDVSYITTPGVQHVNGTQALAYARIRYTDGGDAVRAERQRIVLDTLIEKLKETPVKQYGNILNELLPLVKTSLSSNEILGVATNILQVTDSPIRQTTFPLLEDSRDSMIGGIYYLTFDGTKTNEEIHSFIFEGNTDEENIDEALASSEK